jgi:hypothetical protein
MAGQPSLYRPGTRVHELAPPHRKGTIIKVNGRGSYATLFVLLDGRGVVSFSPGGVGLG